MLAGATSAFTSQTDFHITAFVFFEGSCLAVLVIGVLIKLKMDSIFQTMMHDDDLIEPARASKGSDDLEEVQKIGGTGEIRRGSTGLFETRPFTKHVLTLFAICFAHHSPDRSLLAP